MNKSNHKKITTEALKDDIVALEDDAKEFVMWANVDSDHASAAGSMQNQHYCAFEGLTGTGQIVEKCKLFINDSLEYAVLLARRNGEKEKMDALYFLGRAFHCVQDFYAHSNWVALGKDIVWDHNPSADPCLKFCLATPDVKTLVGEIPLGFRNSALLGNLSGPTWVQLYKDMRKSPRDVDPIWHPNMHLDMRGSKADIAIWYGFRDESNKLVGGYKAFTRAKRLAILDTKGYWQAFKDRFFNVTMPQQKWTAFTNKLHQSDRNRYSGNNSPFPNASLAWVNFIAFNPGRIGKAGTKIKECRKVFQHCFNAPMGDAGGLSNFFESKWSYNRWDAGIW